MGIPIEGVGIYSYSIQLTKFKDTSMDETQSSLNTTNSSNASSKILGGVSSYFTSANKILTPMEATKGHVGIICNIKMEGLHK